MLLCGPSSIRCTASGLCNRTRNASPSLGAGAPSQRARHSPGAASGGSSSWGWASALGREAISRNASPLHAGSPLVDHVLWRSRPCVGAMHSESRCCSADHLPSRARRPADATARGMHRPPSGQELHPRGRGIPRALLRVACRPGDGRSALCCEAIPRNASAPTPGSPQMACAPFRGCVAPRQAQLAWHVA
jgi:hypothetical protein